MENSEKDLPQKFRSYSNKENIPSYNNMQKIDKVDVKIQKVENIIYNNYQNPFNSNYNKNNEELIKNYIGEIQNQPYSWRRQEIPMNAQIIEEKILKINGEYRAVQYLKGKFIGKGGFAKCYEFTNLETKHKSAVKVVEKSTLQKSRAKQKLISEIKIHRSVHNPHIVQFEHYFEDSENVYILLEMCQNQSLNELLKRRKRITEIEAVYYIRQIIDALKYLHSHRIIHRDLKLGNLFLSEKMVLKVGDFGLATKLEYDGERKRTVCGTPNYIAPEILEGKLGHSYEVDIWAVGVILYTLIVGKPPFETADVKLTYKKIKNCDYHFPDNVIISDPAKNLIEEILVVDPSKRPTLDDILNSDFMNLGLIPRLIPTSTLAIPPTITYIRQFWPEASSKGILNYPRLKRGESYNSNFEISTADKKPYSLSYYQEYEELRDRENKLLRDRAEREKEKEKTGFNIGGDKISAIDNKDNLFVMKPVQPEIIIEKWIDYSSKYGIGYILSNGSIGVYFNDSSKIVLDPSGKVFHYLERRMSDKIEVMTVYNVEDYPKELFKKATLLSHFKNYLLSSGKNDNASNQINPTNKEENHNKGPTNHDENKKLNQINEPNLPQKDEHFHYSAHNNFVYLKKWMKTKQAFLFRLSNKIVQVVFQDHTQIILSSETRQLTYVNRLQEKLKFSLSTALESSNTEMVKRLKYTKDILSHMLTVNKQKETEKEKPIKDTYQNPNQDQDDNKENNPNIINNNNCN
jgi:polo-like kinase 1